MGAFQIAAAPIGLCGDAERAKDAWMCCGAFQVRTKLSVKIADLSVKFGMFFQQRLKLFELLFLQGGRLFLQPKQRGKSSGDEKEKKCFELRHTQPLVENKSKRFRATS